MGAKRRRHTPLHTMDSGVDMGASAHPRAAHVPPHNIVRAPKTEGTGGGNPGPGRVRTSHCSLSAAV